MSITRDNRQILVNPHSRDNKVPAGVLNLGEIGVQHDSVSGAALYVETVADSQEEATVAKFINEVAINNLINEAQGDLQTKIDAINSAVGLPHSGTTGSTQHWDENTTVWDAIEQTYAEMEAGTAAANTKVQTAATPDTHKYMTFIEEVNHETSSVTYTIGLDKISESIDSAYTIVNEKVEALSGVVKEFSAATVESLSAVTERIEQLSAATEDVLAALDFTGVTQEGKPIINVEQENGLVSAEAGNIKAEYVDVNSAQTLDEVLEDIIEKIEANEVASEDGTIVINTEGEKTDLSVNIDGVTLVKDSEGVISADLKLSSVTPSSVNVREEFALIDNSGRQLGDTVKVYKDSSLYDAFLGHVDDILSDPTDPESLVSGSGDTALDLIYHKEDGTYDLVPIDVNDFLEESEFKDGFVVDNHVVKVKVDEASEEVVIGESGLTAPVLSVSEDGVKISHIQEAIDFAVQDLAHSIDADVEDTSDDGHVKVEVIQTDSELTQVVVVTEDIASEEELNQVEESIGLNPDGTFTPDPDSHYASAATSVRDEIRLIDQALNDVSKELEAAEVIETGSTENWVTLTVASPEAGVTALTLDDSALADELLDIRSAITDEIEAREVADAELLGNSASTSAETSIMGIKKLIETIKTTLVKDVTVETGETLLNVTKEDTEEGDLYTISSSERLNLVAELAENSVQDVEFAEIDSPAAEFDSVQSGVNARVDNSNNTLQLDMRFLKVDCGEY